MTQGIRKKIILRMRRKIGRRAKGRTNWKRQNGGVIYFPANTIGHKVKIEVLAK